MPHVIAVQSDTAIAKWDDAVITVGTIPVPGMRIILPDHLKAAGRSRKVLSVTLYGDVQPGGVEARIELED